MTGNALLGAALRIAVTILFDTAALVIWDIGTRSPLRLAADVRAGLVHGGALARGIGRLVLGSVAVAGGIIVSRPVVAGRVGFTIVACWALVTALIVEQIVGPDLRTRRK